MGDELLVAAVMRAGAVLRAEFASRLDDLGLTPVDVEVMRTVAAEGCLSTPLLAMRLKVRPQSLAAGLARLLEADILETEQSSSGRRTTSWVLTREGALRLDVAEGVLHELERQFLKYVPEEQALDLARLLPSALNSVSRLVPPTIFDFMR